MHYQEYTPSLLLRPFIEKFWTLESDDSDTYPMEHLITPNGAEAIIITYQKVAQKFILNKQLIALPEVYILNQLHLPWKVITEGCSGIIGVFFRAGSLYPLLKSNATNTIGQVIELQAFLGSKPVRVLREQLMEALAEERIALVEHFFNHYFCKVPHHQNTIRSTVQLIRQHNGMLPIEKIATRLGISR